MESKLSILAMYNYDPHIFDELELPANIDRDMLIKQILFDQADLSVYITEPSTLRTAIGFWSFSQVTNWERMAEALQEEYNPLHNYDRHEDWTDTGEGEGEQKYKKAGYNLAAGMADADQTNQTTKTGSTHKGHIYGNIGVTTSAQMIQGEIDVRTRYNIYQIISEDFRNKFCIMVY